MLVIDFSQSTRGAFEKGFYKGLGAPYLLFGSFSVPPMIEIKQIPTSGLADADAIGNDWKAIGIDIRTALHQYEQTA